MAKGKFVVKPINRSRAQQLCKDHPHAKPLPHSSKYYMQLNISGQIGGLAVWGWGVYPKRTATTLFGDNSLVKEYLELNRFFVYDWVPQNTPSKFLSITHNLISRYLPKCKYLYTHAAGFQGVIGTIYQAANYDYIGKQRNSHFFYLADKQVLVHEVAIYHRFNTARKEIVFSIFPQAKIWHGYNYKYIYFLVNGKEKQKLLSKAKFKIRDENPTKDDLEIWYVDKQGERTAVDPEFAKNVPIVKLKTSRGDK